ncbi:fructose-specific PTS transporter subunit EIIC [Mycoplasma sp. E35C]|uniref:PTS fructose transporter subunit IIABC n=1 Tax=Mycoplasma sp. E35C TaxID=2801918 RepID=UPI001CA39FC7|nr:fructose-specific PTS transporter subunit EIIC [Mycoplasma sp. E35C]QZX49106.1 PTS sugar transporter subunit IIA [Mycoplasma sp. E35C]
MEINKPEYVLLDIQAKTKDSILKEISEKAFALKLSTNVDDLYHAFLEREKESSTGLQDEFAIPHARTKAVDKPALLFVRLQEGVDWQAIDNKPTKYLFVILVPDNANNEHLEILSKVAVMMMDQTLVAKLKSLNDPVEISNLIVVTLEDKMKNDQPQANDNNQKNEKFIVALTACPVGVAHTYLAAEKLNETAKKLGYQIKVETHGSAGVKNDLTQEEIDKADVILVAADIGLDLSRFNGKKVYKTAIKPAIHEPENLINKALNEAKIEEIKSTSFNQKTLGEKTGVMKHILAGVSYMVPFVILGGICIAIAIGLGKLIYGQSYSAVPGDFFYYLEKVGAVAFTLMIGALGAYIANSIGGRAAIAPAFIVSVLANTVDAIFPIAGIKVATAMGFVGSIFFGLAIGYTVKWINSWNINKTISAIMPIFVIPLGVGLFYGLLAIFVVGAPVGWLMDKFINALKTAFTDGNIGVGLGIGLGILIGAMAGFDMGGPINKVAFLTCSALITSKVYEPMGMMAAAIPVAPLGMGLCTMIFKKKFNENEKTMGVSAFIMGIIGISEGAIPFAVSDPKKAIASNVVGSAVAGAIAGGLGVTNTAAHGGPIVGFLLAVSSNHEQGLAWGLPFFFVAIIAGTLVTCFMYGLLRKVEQKETTKTLPKNWFSFFKKEKSNTQVKGA